MGPCKYVRWEFPKLLNSADQSSSPSWPSVIQVHELGLTKNVDIPRIVFLQYYTGLRGAHTVYIIVLFCSAVYSSDPNSSTSVTDRNIRNSLQLPPCYKKKQFSVPHPFATSYLKVLYFALKYQIKEMRLIIRLFPFAFLFHNFVCAHLFTKTV